MKYLKITAVVGTMAVLALAAGAATTAATAASRTNRTLEQRVHHLEDYQAIQGLLGRYITATDTENWHDYAQVFTRNGELIFMSNRVVGQPAIEKALAGPPRPANATTPPRKLRHLLSNIDIRLEGDHAKGVARWVTMSSDAQGRPVMGGTGYYDDTYVKEDGEWKVSHRIMYADFPFNDPVANLAKTGVEIKLIK